MHRSQNIENHYLFRLPHTGMVNEDAFENCGDVFKQRQTSPRNIGPATEKIMPPTRSSLVTMPRSPWASALLTMLDLASCADRRRRGRMYVGHGEEKEESYKDQ